MSQDEQHKALMVELFRRTSSGGAHSIEDLFTEDARYEGAFHDQYFHGAKAIAIMHGTIISQIFNPFVVTPVAIYPAADGVHVAVECEGEGVAVHDGSRYANRYAGFLRVDDGRISHWREYYNPSAFMASCGPAIGEIMGRELPEGSVRAK